MRFFFKQTIEKITLLLESKKSEELTLEKEPIIDALPSFGMRSPLRTSIPTPGQYVDKPSKNTVLDVDENELELNENTPFVVTPDVKIEVEGGDSFTPPGFSERVN